MDKKILGIIMSSTASSLWAISGISGEILFEKYKFDVDWLVSTRTLISGILLLAIAMFVQNENIFEPFKNKKDTIKLLIFGATGMYLLQYSYFKAIELSNVSFATIMQYTAPFFIFLYESIKYKRKPKFSTIILLILTALGVFLLATKGDITKLAVSVGALIAGLGSAVMISFYSIQPKSLLQKYNNLTIVGWAMLVGTTISNIKFPVWKLENIMNLEIMLNLGNVVILGTAIAFLLYMSSLKYISASLAGLLNAFETVLAALLSIIVFGMFFSIIEIIGFLLVFVSIMILQKRL